MKTSRRKKDYNPKTFTRRMASIALIIWISSVLAGDFYVGKLKFSGMTLGWFICICSLSLHYLYLKGAFHPVSTWQCLLTTISPFAVIGVELIVMYFMGKNVGSKIFWPDFIRSIICMAAYQLLAIIYFMKTEVTMNHSKLYEDYPNHKELIDTILKEEYSTY